MKAALCLTLTMIAGLLPAGAAELFDRVNAAAIRDFGYDGKGTAIAILDGPIDTTHPLLRDKVVLEACFAPSGSAECGTGARTLETGEVVNVSGRSAACRGRTDSGCIIPLTLPGSRQAIS
jgi:hypothetical protein